MPAVRAALVTPLSGPLADYGRATAIALRLWAEQFAGPEAVRLDVLDAHPDPPAAVRRAERDRPDLLFGPYGSRPMAEVAGATSRLVWNHSGARVREQQNVVNILAPARTYFTGAVDLVRGVDPHLRSVSVLHAKTGFSRSVADGAIDAAVQHGLTAHRAHLPSLPAQADMLLVAGRFEDELAVARSLPRGKWRAIGFVAAGVEEVLAELGSSREGLLGPAQWMPETAPDPDEGPPAADFVAAYNAQSGSDPPYPAAQAFAGGVIAMRCLREAGVSRDAELLAVARQLDCTTLLGRFRIDSAGRQVGHRSLIVQWQGGARVVVWPLNQAKAPLRYPLQ